MSEDDFRRRFPDEEAAFAYLENQRWGGGVICPRCGSSKIGSFGRDKRQRRCNTCHKPFNVKTGSIFEHSKIPLDKWLLAFYKITTARKGISSIQLSKELGITQKSAWFMSQRIRKAMAARKYDYVLKGIVECDETYVGGKKYNKRWNAKKYVKERGAVGKTPVFGMAERGGRMISMVVPDTSKATLQGIIRKYVAKGSAVCTDEWRSYIGLSRDYNHGVVCHKKGQYANGMFSTNAIESAWAVVKRGYKGVYHSMSKKHTQRYMDEFDFRHNEGSCRIPTMERIGSLAAGCWGRRLTWKELAA
jgi:transposase-like protein